MEYYAGIGTRRRLPEHVAKLMTLTARKMESLNYTLRSGGSVGSDKAFEEGVTNPELKEIFRPKHSTPESIKLASEHHPFWERCDNYARQLHGRNSQIILGKFLNVPVKFVVCFTPDGKHSGGTGLGMNIAQAYKIPVFNLYYPSVKKRFEEFVIDNNAKVDMF